MDGRRKAKGVFPDRKQEVKRLLEQLAKKHEERIEKRGREQDLRMLEKRGKSRKEAGEVKGGVAEEGKNFIFKLPDEILEVILMNVKDAKDLESCYNTCTKFREILQPRKLDIVLPYVLKHLKKKTFFKCRLVSKTWMKTVDKVVDDFLYPEDVSADSSCKLAVMINRRRPHEFIMDRYNYYKLDKFMEEMDQNLLKNPFIGRRVTIGGTDSVSPDYWQQIQKILERFGNDIWDCEMRLVTVGRTSQLVTLCKAVRDCLLQLPNLRKLKISCRYRNDMYELEDICRELAKETVAPLPFLTHLEVCYAPPFIVSMIPIQNLLQVKHLTLNCQDALKFVNKLFDGAKPDNLPVEFPNLTALKIESMGTGAPLAVRDISNLKMMKCPLEKLYIETSFEEINLASFIQILNHFGQTLKYVRMDCNTSQWCSKKIDQISILESSLQLSAPQLTTLEMKNATQSFNFLLGLESLEKLEISNDPGNEIYPDPFDAERENEILEIYGFTKKMYTSNIWAKLPSLKKLNLKQNEELYKYTRVGLEEFKRGLEIKSRKRELKPQPPRRKSLKRSCKKM